MRHLASGIGKYTQKIVEHLTQTQGVTVLPYGAPDIATHSGKSRGLGALRLGSTVEMMCLHAHWARQDRADVYWSPRHHLPFFSGRLPSILTVHDLSWRSHPGTLPLPNLWLERLRMPRSIATADRILVPSETTRRELLLSYPAAETKTVITPLGGDFWDSNLGGGGVSGQDSAISIGSYQIPPGFILFVGGDHPRKNLNLALDGFALASSRVNADLVIAGAIKDEIGLVERLSRRHVAGRVHIVGEVSSARLRALYENCKYVLAPSLHEGFGLPIVEAMQFGKPSIVSANTALTEVAGDSGVAISLGSAASVRDGIVSLMQNGELYNKKSAQASDRAAHYRWSRTAAATLQVFRELL